MTTRTGIVAGAFGPVYANDTSPTKQTITAGGAFVDASLSTGTASATLGAVTGSATGALKIQGTTTATLADLTGTETGALKIQATESTTLDALTGSATGTLKIAGSAAVTLDDLTAASAATIVATGIGGQGSGGVSLRRRKRRRDPIAVFARLRIGRVPVVAATGEASAPPAGELRARLSSPKLRGLVVSGSRGRAQLALSGPALAARVRVAPCGDARLVLVPKVRGQGRHDHFTDAEIEQALTVLLAA